MLQLKFCSAINQQVTTYLLMQIKTNTMWVLKYLDIHHHLQTQIASSHKIICLFIPFFLYSRYLLGLRI